jgi:hypothetical protein
MPTREFGAYASFKKTALWFISGLPRIARFGAECAEPHQQRIAFERKKHEPAAGDNVLNRWPLKFILNSWPLEYF